MWPAIALVALIRPRGWRWPLVLVVPLAVVEDWADVLEWGARWPRLGRLARLMADVRPGTWIRTLRWQGPYTLVRVDHQDVRVRIYLL